MAPAILSYILSLLLLPGLGSLAPVHGNIDAERPHVVLPAAEPSDPVLTVKGPNGGETLVAGAIATLTWSGVPPTEPIRLEYSIDGGVTWLLIDDQARGLSYQWRVPKTPSNRCLLRATQLEWSIHFIELKGHHGEIMSLHYSPSGDKIVTSSMDSTVKVWDPRTGALLYTVDYVSPVGRGQMPWMFDQESVAFSKDGGMLATTNGDAAKIRDASNGRLLQALTIPDALTNSVAFDPTGKRLAVGLNRDGVQVWNIATGTEAFWNKNWISNVYFWIRFIDDGSRILWFDGQDGFFCDANGQKVQGLGGAQPPCQISKDGAYLFVSFYGGTGTIKRCDMATMRFMPYSFILKGGAVSCLAVSPDGKRVAAGGSLQGESGTSIGTWDPETDAEPWQVVYAHNKKNISWLDYSPDGGRLVSAGFDSLAKVWDASNGQLQMTLKGHRHEVNFAMFSPDGKHIATGSKDSTARIWDDHATPPQSDTSDAFWSIVLPLTASSDVDLKQRPVSSTKDSIVSAFVRNVGQWPFRVDSIRVTGADGKYFRVVSGTVPFELTASADRAVEFQFTPDAARIFTATVEIYTQADTLRQTIRGEGVLSPLAVLSTPVDFGPAWVGYARDSVNVLLLKNLNPAPISISDVRHLGPDSTDFEIISGGGTFTLTQDAVRAMTIRFKPTRSGPRRDGLAFDYAGPGSPASTVLIGFGTLPRLAAPDAAPAMATLCPGSMVEDTLTIGNTGETPLTITRMAITGTNAAEFSTPGFTLPHVIPPGSSDRLIARFVPTSSGSKQAMLTLISDGIGLTDSTWTIPLRGTKDSVGYTLSASSVDFGLVAPNAAIDTVISIWNTGTIPLTWALPMSFGPYTVTGIEPMPVPPGASARVTLRLEPQADEGIRTATITLADELCGASTPIAATAEVAAATAVVALPDIWAAPGDLVEIPIALRKARGIAASGATHLSTSISFNRTLLVPLAGTPSGTVNAENRTIPLNLPLVDSPDTVVARLRFVAALGNDTVTSLAWGGMSAAGGKVGLAAAPGAFHLITCDAGGNRIVRGVDPTALKQITPNPARGALQFEFTLAEDGQTQLYIVDLLGQRVATVVEGDLRSGRHQEVFDATELSAGPYLYILQTPTERLVRRMEIVR